MTDFNLNTTIPAIGHSPAQDYQGIQLNFLNIANLVAVDHITFNANNGGQHKQITFNQDASYVPVPPVSPPQLFTMPVTALTTLPQLFYYTGDAAHSANQYVSNAQGSTFALGGIIIKWGFISALTDPGTLTFPTSPFPNACFSVVMNVQKTTSASVSLNVNTISAANFTYRTNSGGGSGAYYIAIGN